MLRCLQSWKRVLGGFSGLVLLPAVLSAQMNGSNPTNGSEAVRARQKADALLSQGVTDNWRKAAGLLEKAAGLRAADDPLAIDERVMAAELFNATQWQYRSQVNLKTAAEQALSQGRVLAAAEVLLKAATVANQRHHTAEAWVFASQAEMLTHSPHLSALEAASIRDRIAVLPRETVADR